MRQLAIALAPVICGAHYAPVQAEVEARMMADALSDGIIKQFPDKFPAR